MPHEEEELIEQKFEPGLNYPELREGLMNEPPVLSERLEWFFDTEGNRILQLTPHSLLRVRTLPGSREVGVGIWNLVGTSNKDMEPGFDPDSLKSGALRDGTTVISLGADGVIRLDAVNRRISVGANPGVSGTSFIIAEDRIAGFSGSNIRFLFSLFTDPTFGPGDVMIGNIADGLPAADKRGVFWDQSAGTFTIFGTIIATIGGDIGGWQIAGPPTPELFFIDIPSDTRMGMRPDTTGVPGFPFYSGAKGDGVDIPGTANFFVDAVGNVTANSFNGKLGTGKTFRTSDDGERIEIISANIIAFFFGGNRRALIESFDLPGLGATGLAIQADNVTRLTSILEVTSKNIVLDAFTEDFVGASTGKQATILMQAGRISFLPSGSGEAVIFGNFLPDDDNLHDLGSISPSPFGGFWKNLFVNNISSGPIVPKTTNAFDLGSLSPSFNWNNIFVNRLRNSADLIECLADFVPTGTQDFNLGVSGSAWGTLFINHVNLDTTATAGQIVPTIQRNGIDYLFFQSDRIESSKVLSPNADNLIDLGTSALKWKDVFLHNISFDPAGNPTIATASNLQIQFIDAVSGINRVVDLFSILGLFFAGSDPPVGSAVKGQLYFNSISNKMKIFTGTIWETVTSS